MVDPAGVDTPGIAAPRRGSTRAEVVLGVDFGTSYTSAGAMIDGRVDLIRDNGDAVIPRRTMSFMTLGGCSRVNASVSTFVASWRAPPATGAAL